MYTENATGHWFGGNYIVDALGISGSQAPMNIQSKTWADIDGKHFDTTDAEQNIELGTIVLGKIAKALVNPTVAKIATLWNGTSYTRVSNFGARVEYNYKNKCWDGITGDPELEY